VLPVDAGTSLQEDLKKSGLVPDDIGAYPAQEAELAAVGIRPHMYLESPGVGTPGYVVPYYDMTGSRVPFYRVKLFRPLPKGAKYLQPANTGSWVYFPRKFAELLRVTLEGKSNSCLNGYQPCLIICEGEKKAAKAVQEGFLCAGLGGVYNWRTKLIELPGDTKLFKTGDVIMARLEGAFSSIPTSDKRAVLASGLPALIQLAIERDLNIVIAFDTDLPINNGVQRAAAELGFELRTQGVSIERIRQLSLPMNGSKVGLDDFLVGFGSDALRALLHKILSVRNAFPRHPNLKSFINTRMEGLMPRSEAKELSLMMLSDMDANGMRMVEKGSGTPYYFDSRTKALMRVNLLHHHMEPLHETRFGEFMYRNYDVSQADSKLIYWIAAGFTGEPPVQEVNPRSVLALMPNNKLAYQIDDGHFLIVTGDEKAPISIVENGTEGLLFKADQVEAVDGKEVLRRFQEQLKLLRKGPKFEDLMWPASLRQFKFVRPNDWKVLSILCYMSPWLLRWNGTQLPVELMIGEPGSGKSSLYGLRLLTLTGRPALRNQPTDIRDWYASITALDGLHVVDNVHFASKELRQRLSDEICRITTEPSPTVEMRKLFTTSENIRFPVRTAFAVTAIQQPFMNADILQRSLIFELQAVGTEHSSDWAGQAMAKFGGRAAWLGHQLAVLHLFFSSAEKGNWKFDHRSQHRLANFEQIFVKMGEILGMEDVKEVAQNLAAVAEEQVSEYDWTMEALREFCVYALPIMQSDPKKVVTTQDVATWAMSREEYAENPLATNARRLSRYIHSHKYMVEKCTGLFNTNVKYGNRESFRVQPIKKL